jgi:hypothetical protein
VDINDHYEVGSELAKAGELGTQLIDTLEGEWDRSYQRSTHIIQQLGEFIWSLRTKGG